LLPVTRLLGEQAVIVQISKIAANEEIEIDFMFLYI